LEADWSKNKLKASRFNLLLRNTQHLPPTGNLLNFTYRLNFHRNDARNSKSKVLTNVTCTYCHIRKMPDRVVIVCKFQRTVAYINHHMRLFIDFFCTNMAVITHSLSLSGSSVVDGVASPSGSCCCLRSNFPTALITCVRRPVHSSANNNENEKYV
jgi:hypothetical protein